VWLADFDPVRGHEQAGRRPALVVSTDGFNTAPIQLVAVVPLTTRDRGISSHVRIAPPDGGLVRPSVILCDQLRIMSQDRLDRRLGRVSPTTLVAVNGVIRRILGL
jgi:mRNA interferase MazF